jgi:hypothetical protein
MDKIRVEVKVILNEYDIFYRHLILKSRIASVFLKHEKSYSVTLRS